MEPHVDKDKIIDNGSKPINGHSKFDEYNYNLAGTYRFGEIGVCDVQDTVPDQDMPLYSAHDVRSFNLKAPLLGNIRLHKEYFDVPYPVLLPKNYDKVFTNPQIGEDVPPDAGLTVKNFDKKLRAFFSALYGEVKANEHSNLSPALLFALSIERFFSKGCLLASLGIQYNSLLKFRYTESSPERVFSVDSWLNSFWTWFFESARSTQNSVLRIDDLYVNFETGSNTELTNHQLLERMRDASIVNLDATAESIASWPLFLDDGFSSFVLDWAASTDTSGDTKPFMMGRPLAYQVVCAEFYTNSHVDYIYSANLFRQNVMDFYNNSGVDPEFFTVNGVQFEYDYLSAHYVDAYLTLATTNITQAFGIPYSFLDWSRLLFGFNRSLRYVDYFTGSRTRPLAVGDVNVQVHDGFVNVVDTIRKRWYAKFLNQVNRVQRKLSDYSRALFPNLTLQRDFHDPMWLAHVEDSIGNTEVESTVYDENSQNQNTTSSVLRSNAERYAFEYHTQYYGVAIGVIYFDIKRYYTDIIERQNFYEDRDDFFNPFLQFSGDQKVYGDEFYAALPHSHIFGYQGSYMEYKERVDQCFGGFAEKGVLPGWLFISKQPIDGELEDTHVSPDFIRSKPSELDEFFSSLTGFDLSRYWHFIIVNKNICPVISPMVYNPQLD